METRANVVAIGLFVLAIMGMGMTALYWLATTGDATEETDLIVVFEGAVTGLSKSAAVYFNGIKIGSVSRIEFSKNDPTRVLAYATIDATAPLKKDTTAELGFQGLTGVAYIELKGGTISSEDLLGDTGTPRIVANPSFFQDILDTARGFMTKADVTLTEINTLLKDTREPLTNTAANVESFSKALADNSENISTFLKDISEAGKSFASLSGRLETLVAKIDPVVAAVEPEAIAAILKDAALLTKQLADASGRIETLMANAESASQEVKDFATGLNTSLKSVDGILAAVDQKKVANTIDGLEAITGSFKDRKDDVSAMIVDARGAAKNVNIITERIAARAEDLEGIIVDARKAVQNAGKLTENLNETALKADKVVAAIDPEAVKGTVDNVSGLTDRLAARADDVDKIITNTSATLEETRAAAKNINVVTERIAARADDVEGIIADARLAVQNAGILTKNLNETTLKADKIVAAIEPDAVKGTVDSVNLLTGRLAARANDVDKIITDTGATLEETRAAATDLKEITASLSARRGSVDTIITNVETATGKLPAMTSDISAALEQVKLLAQAVEADKVNRTMANVEKLTGRLADKSDDIDAIIANARKSTENVESFTGTLAARNQDVEAIVEQALSLSKRLNAASVRIDGLLAKADGMLGDEETGGLISEAKRAATSIANIAQAFEARAGRISRGVDRLTSSGVSKFEKLLDLGQRALRQIERSVQNLEQNPQRVLFGGPQVRQVGGNRR